MLPSTRNDCWQLSLASFLVVGGAITLTGCFAIASLGDCTLAQITPDTTLGRESSVVTPNVDINGIPSDQIDGGARRGANLFHSFQQFNINQGRGVYFTNPVGIENILNRVTGGSRSEILGTLGVLGNANLFVINPNGIIFGPDANLDVGGSFVATTANAIQFGNQGFFSASAPNVPPLLSVNPSAFLFNQIAAQPINSIENRGFLFVPDGESLLLVGGNVSPSSTSTGSMMLDGGGLVAFGGRIELAGVLEPGTIELNVDKSTLRLSFPDGLARADISLMNEATVNTSGEGGGDIQVQGRRVTLTDGSAVFASTLGSQRGGSVFIRAEQLDIKGFSVLGASTFGSGKGGDVTIETGKLTVRDGSQVVADTSPGSEGSAGNLSVIASQSVELRGTSANGKVYSGLFAGTRGTGAGGNLTIQTGRLIVWDGAQVFAGTTTNSKGAGGNLSVTASQSVELGGTSADGKLFSNLSTQTQGAGAAGDLNIQTGQLTVRDGAQISASTFGQGAGGNLAIAARDSVEVSGTLPNGQFASAIGTSVERGATGIGGNLTLETGRLIVRDGAQISAGTFGQGAGGNLALTARESVELIGTSANELARSGLFTSAESGSAGAGGNLTLETKRLIVRDGARIDASTYSQGSAGNVAITAHKLAEVSGTSANGQPSNILTSVGPSSTGAGGNLILEAGRLIIRDGAQVGAGTFGDGPAGDLLVSARESVELIGISANGEAVSSLFTAVEPGATGAGGNLILQTGRLIIRDGAQVSAGTFGAGMAGDLVVRTRESVELIGTSADGRFPSSLYASAEPGATGAGGNLTLETGRLIIQDGAQVSTGTDGTGRAGNLSVRTRESVQLIGISANGQFPSLLSAQTSSTGDAGDLRIETGQLTVRDGAVVSVNSEGLGKAGNLVIAARSIKLDNQGSILAATLSGNGGNIALQDLDLLLLRRGSQISTTAGVANAGGDGGNISIDATEGFVVAVPSENSDITANAFTGKGGRVQVTAQGIFGLVPRSREELQVLLGTDDPNQLDPARVPTSDITAISQTNPALSGQVTLNTLDVDPSRGLVNLPVEPANTELAQGCQPDGSQLQSSFVVTGRGGLPPNPGEALSPDAVEVDLVRRNPEVEERSHPAVSTNPTRLAPAPLVEAQGWMIGDKGEVILTASTPTVTPHHSSWQGIADCQTLNHKQER